MTYALFREKWPDGITVAAHVLMTVLPTLDDVAAPLEGITDPRELEGFARVVQEETRNLLQEARKLAGIDTVKKKAAEVGADLPPDTAREAKLARKHIKALETQAQQFLAQLGRRIVDPKTRSRTLLFLREWKAANESSGASRKQLAASLLDYLRNDHLEAPSDNLTRQLLERIERADFELEEGAWPVARGMANSRQDVEHWAYELVPVEEGRKREALFLPAPDLDAKLQTAMAEYARTLGDNDADLMIFAMARFAERAKHPDDKVTITINELMAALGYTRHRGGGADGEAYMARDKAAVRARFERLQDGYLTIRKAGRDPNSRRSVDVQSMVLVIEDRAGQADLNGRVPEWTAVTVRFGRAWSSRLFDEGGRLTALLQARALEYDAVKERIEKRLLKRLGWFWRLNDRATVAARTVGEWITQDVGDPAEDYKRRDAERFEDALHRLRADGQIAGWCYTDGLPSIKELDDALPRGWLDQWLQREISIEAPQGLQVAYQARAKKAPAVEAPKPAQRTEPGIGQRFRALRSALGISALQAARELELDNSLLSRIESGKRLPTSEQRAKLEGWMRDAKQRPDKTRA